MEPQAVLAEVIALFEEWRGAEGPLEGVGPAVVGAFDPAAESARRRGVTGRTVARRLFVDQLGAAVAADIVVSPDATIAGPDDQDTLAGHVGEQVVARAGDFLFPAGA